MTGELATKQDLNDAASLNAEAWRLQYGDPACARACAQRAMALAAAQNDATGQAYARVSLACFEMRHGNRANAEREFNELKLFFTATNDRRGLMRATFGSSVLLSQAGRAEDAYAELFGFLADLATAEPVDVVTIQNALGAISGENGLLDEGLRHFYQALAAARTLDSPDHLALVLSNLGDLQHGAGNYEDAIGFLIDAEEMVKRSRLEAMAPLVSGNLAMCQLAIGAHEAAFQTIQPYLNLQNDDVRVGKSDAAFFRAIAAHTYAAHENWVDARRMVDLALVSAESSGDVRVQSHCYWVQSLIERGLGDPVASLASIKEAEQLLINLQDPYYPVQISRELSQAYALVGDWQQAYLTLEQHRHLYQRFLGSAARARTLISRIQSELTDAERDRDFALLKQAEAERARAATETLNSQLAAKVEEIERLQAQLRDQATRDPLTNLYNRRYLKEELENEIARAERRHYSICVVLIDLDHFKSVNDRFGHPVGDRVLIEMARMLHENIRGLDFACRFGGEEFCLVLSDIGVEAAILRVHGILNRLRELVIDIDEQSLSQLTFSAGVAEFPIHGHDAEGLLARADVALYRAKEAGRDRILAA